MKTETTKPSLQKDVYYATLLDWATRESAWLTNRSFAPGGWAVDFCFLYVMYRALNACRPATIVEYGLGQTTRMLSQYAVRGDEHTVPLATIEHDADWVKFYNSQLDNNIPKFTGGVFALLKNQNYVSCYDVNLEGCTLYSPESYYKYMEEFIKKNGKAQFVSVDAPYGTPHHSRVHLLDYITHDWLDTDHFVIMVDDVERTGEKETIKIFLDVLDNRGILYHTQTYSGEKSHKIIVSDDLRFLCSM